MDISELEDTIASVSISLLLTTSPLDSDVQPPEHKQCTDAAAVSTTFCVCLHQISEQYSKQLSPLFIKPQDYSCSQKMNITYFLSAALVAKGIFSHSSQAVVLPRANSSRSLPPCLQHPIYTLPHHLLHSSAAVNPFFLVRMQGAFIQPVTTHPH